MRGRTPWVPILLSSLALLTVVGGVAVGHFYWTSLRSSMGQMASSMSVARERQRDLLGELDRTQALMAAQQEQLRAEAEALNRREEALAIAHKRLELEREALARERALRERAQQERAGDAVRLSEAARLVETARERLRGEDGSPIARDALAAAWLLLEQVDTPDVGELRERLAAVRTRLDRLEPAGKVALATRLDALRAHAAKLTPSPREERRGRSRRMERNSSVRNLRVQLDTAAFALERGDRALYVQALETADLWLETFFDARRPETRRVAREIERLAAHPLQLDLADSVAELERLSEDLRVGADRTRSTSPPISSQPMGS